MSDPRQYCPGCEPDADAINDFLEVQWCGQHTPRRDGAEDDRVNTEAYLSGTGEAGGGDNRAWCEFIHRAGGVVP